MKSRPTTPHIAKPKLAAPQQVSNTETDILLSLAAATLTVPGDWVELGCYRGDTSLRLAHLLEEPSSPATKSAAEPAPRLTEPVSRLVKPAYQPVKPAYQPAEAVSNPVKFTPKTLWLYDSFAGLPERSKEDASVAGDAFTRGELLVTKREVIEKFKRSGLKRLPRIKKAFFEDLTAADLPEKISFAFLDGDLYSSIRTSLHLVENHLGNGAILVVHDYNNPSLPGVTKAVEEWLKSHPTLHLTQRETLAILRKF